MTTPAVSAPAGSLVSRSNSSPQGAAPRTTTNPKTAGRLRQVLRLTGFALLGMGATSAASAAVVTAAFSSAASVPVTSDGYLASGNTVDLTLGFTPTPGSTLTVVNNTGLGFINGAFDNLANGATVTLSHGGISYDFLAWYYGGTGNDLVLLWPQTSLAGWGRASNGRLAIDQAGNVLVPTDADLSGALAGKTIVQVSRGLSHTLALTSEGKVYAWGDNTVGQLGTNSSFGGFAPVSVFTDNGPTALNGKFVIAIATTRHTSYALCSDGFIASWGENQRGQLGNGTDGNGSNSADSRVPVAVTLSGVLSGKTVVALAGGTHHILALCSDGTVAAWGNGGSGQLGDNSTNDRSTPVLVNTTSGTSALFGKTVVAIAGGGNHSLALCSDGTVVAWGSNSNGQLGDNSTTSRNAPVAVNTTSGTSALFGKTVTAIAAGNQHSIALNSDGTVATWGRNNRNQLGDNSITDSSVPVAMNTTSGVSALFGKSVQAIAAGLDGNLALTTDGALAAWGYNQLGQVGDGFISATRAVPTAVSVENGVSVLSGKAIISLADSGSASDHFMALYATLPEVIPEQMIAHESNRNWRGVASSADGVKLVAVPNGGYLYTSTDSGVTWLEHTSLGQKNWYAVASSNDGSKLVAVADGSRIFTSTDSGANWTEQFGSSGKQWRTVASSADGTKLIAAANQDRIYTSTDSGITWTVRFNNGNWLGVASSADGTKLVAVASSGNIATSNDSGVTWTARMTDQNRNWYGVASSADGTKLVACIYGGQLYTSTDSGVNWTARDSSRDWQSVASSADGTHLIASVRNDGLIYVSTDSGVTWSSVDSARNWWGVGISADGAKLFASVYGGQLYTLGSAPEIAVEQPALTDLSSGSTTDFGSVLTGDTADLTFTIRNPGNLTLTGLDTTIDGTDAGLFTLTASPTGPLDPSDTTTFTVRFAPLSNGLKSATLHIASNDGDENPFNIVLNGTGAGPAPEIAVEQPALTDLMTGAMTDFGSVAANSTTDLTFTIRNTGTADLTGVDVTVDGTDSALFTVTATPDSVISPAGSTTFTVRFAPVNTGLKSATLHIASNDLDENPFDISLTGTGTPEQMIARGISQSWRGVTSSADGVKMAAVANNGYLHTSTDSGLTWTARTALGQKSWYGVASSSDGSKLVAVADGSRIFTSTDSGANWTEQFGSNSNVQWRTVASSADGTKLIAAANQDRIYTSIDSGITWTVRFNNGNWNGVASSADGTKLVAVENSGNIFTSTDSGANWTSRMTDQNRNWYGVASSADGTKLVASVYGGQLYTSIDSGITWTARDSSRNWRLVASSFDGSHLIAAERDGLIYVSTDSGVNWTTLDSTRDWYGVAISADGAKILASVFGGQLYTLGTASDISQSGPDFVVTTVDDHDDGVAGAGDTSLREAINAANANPDLSIISFDPTVFGTAQIIQLQSALPALTGNVEIQGTLAGLTVRRDAPGNFRIFSVNSGTTAKLRNLTITNGSPTNGGGGVQNHGVLTVENCFIHDNIAGGEGGGIESFGTLTVINSTIHGNAAGWGGGIESWSDVTVTDSIIRDNTVTYGGGGVDIGEGSATLSGSTINGNSAPVGGGIRHVGSGLLAITNSTISGNLATGSTTNDGGGAIHLNAGYGGGGPGASLDSVTLTANTASNQSGGGRQGLWAAAGDLTLRNTIIVGNGTQDLAHDAGTLLSLGHNLIGMSNAAISFTATGDQGAITDAGLEPLADNGGPTPTHALTLTSPALNAGTTSLTVDQRGEARPSGSAADIGAFELYLAPTETAVVELDDLAATYDGSPHAVSVTTMPTGLTTTVTYAGSTTVPTTAGSYAVVATVTGNTHHGSASGTLVIAKAQSNVSWSTPLPVTYGTALSSTQLNATANVPGVFTYAPLTGTVLDAGLQALEVSFVPTDTINHLGSTGSQNLLVNQATAVVSLSELTPTYDGSPKSAGADTTPSGLSTSITYDGGSTAPTDAGTYAVVATITDANFVGSASGSLVIAKAPTTVSWTTPAAITYGTALSSTQLNATADAAGTFVYDPAAGTILDAGSRSLSVTFTPTDITNRLGDTAAQSITVNPATVSITLGGLAATYDGNPHAVTVTTVPADVPVNVTYASSTTVPTNAGSYAVEATSADSNYTGSASGTLVIAQADPVITWIPSGAYADGDLLDAAALNATADVNGTFTYTPAAGTSLAQGNVELSVEFVPADTTNYRTVTAQRSISVTGSGLAITTQPTAQNSLVGGSVVFTVEASGAAPITYQWQKNEVDLTGATAATLERTNLTMADAGSYRVKVSNGSGASALTLTSDAVSLNVLDVVATHRVSGPGYRSGGTVIIENTITYAGTLSGLGWEVLLPDDVEGVAWAYVRSEGESGNTKPASGTTSVLEWAWFSLPDSPFTFTYTISVPPAASGDYALSALVLPRSSGTQFQGLVTPEPLILAEAPAFHTADTDEDFRIGLTELLRVIELYNTRFGTNRTGRYQVQGGTEDGFAPDSTRSSGETLTLTEFHAADSNQDGLIGLTELLRVIELYNTRLGTQRTGEYHVQPGTEDGFAPGPGA